MYRGVMVGLGQVALHGHLPAWQENKDFQIVAGIDSSFKQLEEFKKKFPQAEIYPTFEACKKLDLDFVDISVPPYLHYPFIQKALDQGLNVLCEKPLCLSESEFKCLEEKAALKSKVLFTVHNWKFSLLCKKISELLNQKVLGEIRYCAWVVLRNGPSVTADLNNWRLDPKKSGGGILLDHGWHALYLILGWLNKKPKKLEAVLENRQYENLPVEDTAKVLIEFENGDKGVGPKAEIFLTWASRLRKNQGVIEGSEGTLYIEDQYLRLVKKGTQESYDFQSPLSLGSFHPDWFKDVITEFYFELQNKEQRGENLKMAKSCLHLLECAKESNQKKSFILL
ncbi:MAG: Gfo/Idh/MocA family oxidoreductase [Elusimicrobia bacterium]|nr:Gfo/Idh/MocA family oxidoreductase [Elusimicrobiota bacterium]